MAPVTLQPTIQLSPFEKYKLALQTYQAQNPQLAGQYSAMSAPMGAPPTAPDPLQAGLTTAAKVAALKTGASAASSAIPSTAPIFNGATSYGGFAGPGASTVATEAAAPSILGNAASMGAGPIAGIGLATILGGKAGYDMLKGKKPGLPGRIILGMASGGLSELPGLAGWGHKSTGERQNERWQGLLEAGSAPEWAFANGVNQDQGFGDRDLAAGIDPRKVWASSAMFDTFGGNWATQGTEAQREEITKQILANKLIDTKQGVSYMLDKTKANDIFKSVIGKDVASMLAPQPGAVIPTTKLPAPVRKDSPGFKDGKRINYGAKK